MLRRYPDAIRTFVSILNWIMRMRQYHTRSYQYDQVRPRLPFFVFVFELTGRADQQNGGPDVRAVCDLQRAVAEQAGR